MTTCGLWPSLTMVNCFLVPYSNVESRLALASRLAVVLIREMKSRARNTYRSGTLRRNPFRQLFLDFSFAFDVDCLASTLRTSFNLLNRIAMGTRVVAAVVVLEFLEIPSRERERLSRSRSSATQQWNCGTVGGLERSAGFGRLFRIRRPSAAVGGSRRESAGVGGSRIHHQVPIHPSRAYQVDKPVQSSDVADRG